MSAAAPATQTVTQTSSSTCFTTYPYTKKQFEEIFQKEKTDPFTNDGICMGKSLCYRYGDRVDSVIELIRNALLCGCSLPIGLCESGICFQDDPNQSCCDPCFGMILVPCKYATKVIQAAAGVIYPPLYFSNPDPTTCSFMEVGCKQVFSRVVLEDKRDLMCEGQNPRIISTEYTVHMVAGTIFSPCLTFYYCCEEPFLYPLIPECLLTCVIAPCGYALKVVHGVAGIFYPPLLFKKKEPFLSGKLNPKEKVLNSDMTRA